MLIYSLALLSALFTTLQAACFHCISPDAHLTPLLRSQLSTQIDVFFWQYGTKSQACSTGVNSHPYGVPSIESQLCASENICVTVQPNIENVTFVVRGCLENVLRHGLRENERMHQEGCYMVRSKAVYPSLRPTDYVVCVCRGDYCNGQEPASFVPGPFVYGSEALLQLEPSEEDESVLLVSSTSNSILFCATLCLSLLLR